jgi:hypothetical protein
MDQLLDFLAKLKHNSIPYTLEHNYDDGIMVILATPTERWEVTFFQDRRVAAEVFRSADWCEGDQISSLLDLSLLGYPEQ